MIHGVSNHFLDSVIDPIVRELHTIYDINPQHTLRHLNAIFSAPI